ncbi:MAG: InlB B-repeat-containing protein, partial [Oscillospiraceae bacterium]|nr:InlB B-repeat-containing protein [Oscillospiraceae bacterium]
MGMVFGMVAVGGVISNAAVAESLAVVPPEPVIVEPGLTGVVFVAPEVIYLQPSTNAVGTATNWQYYVDTYIPRDSNPANANYHQNIEQGTSATTMSNATRPTSLDDPRWTKSTSRNKADGTIYFYCPGASNLIIDRVTGPAAAPWNTNMAGASWSGGSTNGQTNQNSYADPRNTTRVNSEWLYIRIGNNAQSTNESQIITWRARFTVGGKDYEAYTYSYVYKPDYVPTALGVRIQSTNNGESHHHTMSWVNGLHSNIPGTHRLSAATNNDSNNSIFSLLVLQGNSRRPIVHNNSQLNNFYDTSSSSGTFTLRNFVGGGGAVTTHFTGTTDTNLSGNYNTSSSFMLYTAIGGEEEQDTNLWVDTSRYNNYSQIPNLTAFNATTWSGNNNGSTNTYRAVSWDSDGIPNNSAPQETDFPTAPWTNSASFGGNDRNNISNLTGTVNSSFRGLGINGFAANPTGQNVGGAELWQKTGNMYNGGWSDGGRRPCTVNMGVATGSTNDAESPILGMLNIPVTIDPATVLHPENINPNGLHLVFRYFANQGNPHFRAYMNLKIDKIDKEPLRAALWEEINLNFQLGEFIGDTAQADYAAYLAAVKEVAEALCKVDYGIDTANEPDLTDAANIDALIQAALDARPKAPLVDEEALSATAYHYNALDDSTALFTENWDTINEEEPILVGSTVTGSQIAESASLAPAANNVVRWNYGYHNSPAYPDAGSPETAVGVSGFEASAQALESAILASNPFVGIDNALSWKFYYYPTVLVTFDANGGEIPAEEDAPGLAVTDRLYTYTSATPPGYDGDDEGDGLPPVPVWPGFIFQGWFTEGDGEEEGVMVIDGGGALVDSGALALAENHTLAAQWSSEECVVSYNTVYNGGEQVLEEDSFSLPAEYGTRAEVEDVGLVPVKGGPEDGWAFVGWATEAGRDGQVPLEAETAPVITNSSVTLYALYKKVLEISFIDAGGPRVVDSSKTTLWNNETSIDIAAEDVPAVRAKGLSWTIVGNGSDWAAAADAFSVVPPGDAAYAGLTDSTAFCAVYSAQVQLSYAQGSADNTSVPPAQSGTRLFNASGSFQQPVFTLAVSSTLLKNGNDLIKWSIGGQEYDKGAEFIPAENSENANFTATPVFAPSSYTVTLIDPLSGAEPAEITVTYDALYPELPDLTALYAASHVFGGWYLTPSYNEPGKIVEGVTKVTATNNHFIYAKLTPNQYTVSYDTEYNLGGMDGTESFTAPADHGDRAKIDFQTAPVKGGAGDGWEFAGWVTEANKDTNNPTVLTGATAPVVTAEGLTLYAVYKKVITVTWIDSSYASPVERTIWNKATGVNITKISPDNIPSGWSYYGWSEAENGIDDDAVFANVSTDKDYYAVYRQTVSLTYRNTGATGGSAPASQSEYRYRSASGYIAQPSFELAGCSLVQNDSALIGWLILGEAYAVGDFFTPPGGNTVTLYRPDPIFAPPVVPQYTISFEKAAGDGSDGLPPGEITQDELTYAALPGQGALSWEGYIFRGWSTDGALENLVANQYYLTDDVTLYAAWEAEPSAPEEASYLLSFGMLPSDTAKGALPAPMLVPVGESVTLPGAGGLTRPGWVFFGWSADGSLDTLADNNYTPVSDNITLYATWVAQPSDGAVYAVSFVREDAGESDGDLPAGFTLYASDIKVIRMPGQGNLERAYHDWLGWSVDGVLITALSHTITDDTVFVATWEKNTYTVTLEPGDLDGDGEPDDPIVIEVPKEGGEGIELPKLTRPKYRHLGWSPDGTPENMVEEPYIPEDEATLEPVWEQVAFDICFEKAAGDTDSTGTMPLDYLLGEEDSREITLPQQDDLDREHYSWLGWSVAGTLIESDSYLVTQDVTFTATWSLNSYT